MVGKLKEQSKVSAGQKKHDGFKAHSCNFAKKCRDDYYRLFHSLVLSLLAPRKKETDVSILVLGFPVVK